MYLCGLKETYYKQCEEGSFACLFDSQQGGFPEGSRRPLQKRIYYGVSKSELSILETLYFLYTNPIPQLTPTLPQTGKFSEISLNFLTVYDPSRTDNEIPRSVKVAFARETLEVFFNSITPFSRVKIK